MSSQIERLTTPDSTRIHPCVGTALAGVRFLSGRPGNRGWAGNVGMHGEEGKEYYHLKARAAVQQLSDADNLTSKFLREPDSRRDLIHLFLKDSRVHDKAKRRLIQTITHQFPCQAYLHTPTAQHDSIAVLQNVPGSQYPRSNRKRRSHSRILSCPGAPANFVPRRQLTNTGVTGMPTPDQLP